MADRRSPAPEQLEFPRPATSPSSDERRAKRADLIKWRKAMEHRRLLVTSRVEFEQLPN